MPSPPTASPVDPGQDEIRAELIELSRSLRAHVDVLLASGAWGVPAGRMGSERARVSSTAPDASQRTESTSAEAASTQASAAIGSLPPGPLLPADQLVRRVDLTTLEPVAEAARVCTKCGLHATRRQSVFARGTGASGLVFVGEGPGEEEDHQGLPFVGAAGQLLDRMIAAMQLARDDVYVCNIVKCRPPQNRKPDLEEMSRCMPYLAEQLAVIKPRVIVALGATAVQGLLGTTEGITRLRGQWKLYRGSIPVMPTFHPAYLLRQPQAKREVWKDLQEVLRQLVTNRPGAP